MGENTPREPCVFCMRPNSEIIIILLIFVDDILVTGNSKPAIFDILNKLESHF